MVGSVGFISRTKKIWREKQSLTLQAVIALSVGLKAVFQPLCSRHPLPGSHVIVGGLANHPPTLTTTHPLTGTKNCCQLAREWPRHSATYSLNMLGFNHLIDMCFWPKEERIKLHVTRADFIRFDCFPHYQLLPHSHTVLPGNCKHGYFEQWSYLRELLFQLLPKN